MKKIFSLLVVIGISQVVEAQNIDSYELHYYNAGATVPFQIFALPAGSYACNQVPIVSTLTSNPTTVEWNDPTADGRACIYVEVPGGPLLSFPVGNYEATLVAINNFGKSPESNRVPFVLGSSPGTPTGFRVVR